MTGETKSGFHYELEDDALEDMELLDALSELGEASGAASRVVVRLLGKQQRKALYDHIRDENGKVRPAKVMEEISDIFEALGQAGKNS